MTDDPVRKEFASQLYRGFLAASLNLGRQLVLRQLFLTPEPAPLKDDPYIQCPSCTAPEKCDADRQCARFAAQQAG